MNQAKFISIFILGLLLQSCSTLKNETFWVSGTKSDCSAGAGKLKCLNVHKGKNLEDAKWENFYAPIEGFQFEEGYLKKIKVKAEKIDNPPADGSSIKYRLVKELEKKVDYRVKVGGKWILSEINDQAIDSSIALPEMEIMLSQMKISGTGGCNNYTGEIAKLTSSTISFGNIANTNRACFNKNIEKDYFTALNATNTFKIKEDKLIFYDKDGNIKLSFMMKKAGEANQRIHDIWTAVRIGGKPINRMSPIPRMEINLTDMKVMCNDGCNDYTGTVKEVSDKQITFGNIVVTKKMCRKMDVPDSFNQAILNVSAYKLDNLNLILMDKNGKEILAFLKGD